MRSSALFTLALAAVAPGCPGAIGPELEAELRAAREGGANAMDGASPSACPPGINDVQRDLLVPRCATAGCHTRADNTAGLDLESPALGSRLINVRASMTGSCANRTLVTVNGGVVEGVLLGKLVEPAVCGLRMPIGRGTVPLTTQEIECLRGYLRTLPTTPAGDAGAASMDASAPRDGGQDGATRG